MQGFCESVSSLIPPIGVLKRAQRAFPVRGHLLDLELTSIMIKQLLSLILLLVGGIIYLRDSGMIGISSTDIPSRAVEGSADPLTRSTGVDVNDFHPVRKLNNVPHISIQYCTS